MDIRSAATICLKQKYLGFSGRASRAEFWYFALFAFIISMCLIGMHAVTGIGLFFLAQRLFSLAIALPSLAVGYRRFHDIGKSGWWYWIILVPLIGIVIWVYLLAKQGDDGPNLYGAKPVE